MNIVRQSLSPVILLLAVFLSVYVSTYPVPPQHLPSHTCNDAGHGASTSACTAHFFLHTAHDVLLNYIPLRSFIASKIHREAIPLPIVSLTYIAIICSTWCNGIKCNKR